MSKKQQEEAPVREPSFEQSLGELEAVVRQLEGGDLPLEKSIELFERGMKLNEICRRQLATAESRVEILLKKGETVAPAPFGEPAGEDVPF
jgi:exodeoxyribonuclease VII small subunit